MESNSKIWDSENFAIYSDRAIEIPKNLKISITEIEVEKDINNNISLFSQDHRDGFCSHHDSGHNSASLNSTSAKNLTDTYEGMNYHPKDNSNEEDFIRVNKSNNSFFFGEPTVGLKLESPENRANMLSSGSSNTSSSSNSVSSNKRSRVSYQGMLTICCQVEGCNLDLTSAKDYHRRHRICESHSKSPKVIVAGMERRFCQQCSRLHNLSEFDDKKRSCRRRLSDHNARRRRPQPDASRFSRTGVFSSVYEGRAVNLLLNKNPSSVSSSWEGFSRSKMTQSGNPLIRPQVDIDRKQHFPSDDVRNAISLQRLNSGIAANSGKTVFPRALPLLSSTTSWGLNDPEPTTSMEQLMQLESQTWQLISSENAAAEQEHSVSPMHSMDMQSTNSSEFQEFQPFKTICESGFYNSSRIN